MFDGELASLSRIGATGCVRVPQPMAVMERPRGGGAMLVMEHLELRSIGGQARVMGGAVARCDGMLARLTFKHSQLLLT